MKNFTRRIGFFGVLALTVIAVLSMTALAMSLEWSSEAALSVSMLGLGVGMAVANTKSTQITNGDATPHALTSPFITGGMLREYVGTVETLAADDAASVYRLVRVPSNIRISSILLASDAITGASASDVGVYQTAENGGAVVDADFFATDVDISSATAFTEVLLEATATDIDKVEKRLWELLGLSADPNRHYDICVTVNDVTAAGTISMKLKGAV